MIQALFFDFLTGQQCFYTHFKSKDQIIIENFLYLNSNYDEAIKGLEPESNIFEKMYVFQQYAMQQLEKVGWKAVKLVYHVEAGPDKEKSFLISKRFSLYKIILSLVREGQKKGEIRKDQTADALTDILVQLYRGVVFEWCLSNGAYSLVEAAGKTSLFVYEGIRSR